MFKYLYVPSKPVTFRDLPPNNRWQYVEAPHSMKEQAFGIPVSVHEFGVIATEKMVLQTLRDKLGLTDYIGRPQPIITREPLPKREPSTTRVSLEDKKPLGEA